MQCSTCAGCNSVSCFLFPHLRCFLLAFHFVLARTMQAVFTCFHLYLFATTATVQRHHLEQLHRQQYLWPNVHQPAPLGLSQLPFAFNSVLQKTGLQHVHQRSHKNYQPHTPIRSTSFNTAHKTKARVQVERSRTLLCHTRCLTSRLLSAQESLNHTEVAPKGQ